MAAHLPGMIRYRGYGWCDSAPARRLGVPRYLPRRADHGVNYSHDPKHMLQRVELDRSSPRAGTRDRLALAADVVSTIQFAAWLVEWVVRLVHLVFTIWWPGT